MTGNKKIYQKKDRGNNKLLYRCVNCGGNVVYEPSKKMMICMSCGGSECQEVVPSKEPMVCVNCGSQIPYTEFQSAGRCPACGTLKEEFGKKLFLPGSFLSQKTLEHLKGVYVPFWMYDYDSNVDYQAVGTKVRTWTSGDKRYTETSYFDVARKIHVNYQGIPVDASIAMEDGIMDLMEPYDYAELIKHDNKFLSGFEAETYNMPPDQLAFRAQEKADKANRGWIREYTSGYDTLTSERFTSNNRQTGTKFALMPVWVYEYRFQNQNYKFYVGLTALVMASVFIGLDGLSLLLGVL